MVHAGACSKCEPERARSKSFSSASTPKPKQSVKNGNAHSCLHSGITFSSGGGTQTAAWTSVLCGSDYAEAVDAESGKHYEHGDVLVLSSGDDGEVEKSAEPYSALVAGIYATKPRAIGRRQNLSASADELPMAMVGIVPTKVAAENGPIHKGDLLVTSSAKGYAIKKTDRSQLVGAVLGKARCSLNSGTGVIQVLVTLR